MNKNILYVGLGGAGKNVIKMAYPDKLNKEEILFINTDKKALEEEGDIPTLLIGKKILKGESAGTVFLGSKAIDESIAEIISIFQKYEKIIIISGVGGTGGAVIHLVKQLLQPKFSIDVFLLYPHHFESERVIQAKELVSQAAGIQSERVTFQILTPSTYAEKCKGLTPLSLYLEGMNKLMVDSVIVKTKVSGLSFSASSFLS